MSLVLFLFQAEDGIRDLVRSRGLGDVYKRQVLRGLAELGLFGVTLPEEFGGAGLTALDATRLVLSLIHI